MMKQRALLWTVPVALATIGAVVWLQQHPSEASPEANETRPIPMTVNVRVAPVVTPPEREVRWLHSTVQAGDQAVVSFITGGRLMERPVQVGDRVKKGDLLAVLDRAPQRNMLAVSQADTAQLRRQIEQYRRDLDRAEALRETNGASDEEVEQVATRLEATQAALRGAQVRIREARRQFSETLLKAPFEGTISKIMIEPGEFASPGAPVLYMQGSNQCEIELSVPERLIGALSQTQEVSVRFPLSDLPQQQGTITDIALAAGDTGGLFTVIVAIACEHEGLAIRPGTTVAVALGRPIRDRLAVPMAAVVDPTSGSPGLFVVKKGVAHHIPVQLGVPLDGSITVRPERPLQTDDQVVVAGHIGLQDGARVEVSP
ncbi:MAG: efflux RND transporter periplasmic adaptor subunit [Myxococcota bacterium]